MSGKPIQMSLLACIIMTLLIGAAQVKPVVHLRDPADPRTCLSAIAVTYGPGQSSKPHRHEELIIAYVLEGAISSQVEGESLRTYAIGEHWTEAPGAFHMVSENASATKAAKFLVVALKHIKSKRGDQCAG
jgi:quercetin dioxygenase-like cupin family protein